jgi:N-acetylglucosaminyldiphosphoundecaprenol N-acetyl-beta-D-mannosaminyltransferase
MSSNILNYKVYDKSKLDFIEEIFKKNEKIHIVSGNPEVLENGLRDQLLYDNFTSSKSMIIPDGIGVVISSKIVREPVKEKIPGIEVMDEILKKCENENKSIYLLGTKQETLELCVEKLHEKYPKLIICGSHNGYFDINNCNSLLENINEKKPFAIFVAMGAPRQEIFITKYMENLNASIFMGVGGSFDNYAGIIKRAPKWMIKLGLEWLYRVAKEPFRIKRLSVIPKFMVNVFINKYLINKKNTTK